MEKKDIWVEHPYPLVEDILVFNKITQTNCGVATVKKED